VFNLVNNKKISILIPTLSGGGAERVMLNLAIGLSQEGYDVDLILSKFEGAYVGDIPDGVNIVNLNVSRAIFCLPLLIKYLRKNMPMALISALNYVNIIAILATKLARVKTKLMVTEHSTLSKSLLYPENLRMKFVPFLMKCLYRLADYIVAVSSGVADDLSTCLEIPRNKIIVIYNPIINESLYYKATNDSNLPSYFNSCFKIVLSVGRLTAAKDFSTLIQAFSRVRNKLNAKLLILGEGELRSDLQDLINNLSLQNDVILNGFVDNPYIYMKNASVFVLSSKWEGLPTVLVEALACGTQVISTNCPSGPSEILEDGKYGMLVPVGDVELLSEAIYNSLNNPSKSNEADLIKRANDFNIAKIAKQYIEVLSHI
jgi:glycosyltransferase involved in cell wall biosynthesis